MLFNSLTFPIFFLVVYSSYLALQRHLKIQNLLLLVASYVFYGFWDWRFLSLILISTLVDFFVGKLLHGTDNYHKRRALLALSIITNLSILGFFKYFSFFADSFAVLLSFVGMKADFPTLNIILPVGISFYTFQSLSYTFDIYRGKIKPIGNFFDFALFVAFFPQLVAGPIERAVNLLPQISYPRSVTMAQVDAGLFLILWGYFKKVVIADNVGLIADEVFNGYTQFDGLDIVIGVLAFTVQIYSDFSGYSDIARGLGKLMGFELMVNFRLPYFALNPSDFWARWHISLSSWLRDYLYIALGGNRKGPVRTYRNLLLTMLLGGLWHGAAWNFVIWGAYHGIILCLYRMFEKNPEHNDPWSGGHSYFRILGKMALMFTLTVIGWIFFRSQSVHQISYMLTNISLDSSKDTIPLLYQLTFFSAPLILVHVYQYITSNLLVITRHGVLTKGLIYGLLCALLLVFSVRESIEFIYFQF